MSITPEQRLPTAIALLALFVALGGTSYAAVKLKKDSVTTREIKDATVLGADLAPGVAISGPRGPRGADGPSGPQGPAGPTGPRGVSQVYTSRSNALFALPNSSQSRIAVGTLRLPAGSYALQFTAHAFNYGGSAFVDCSLETPSTQIAKTAATIGNGTGAAFEQSIVIGDAATFAELTTVVVRCSLRGATENAQIADARLIAQQVSAIEAQ